MFSYVQYSYLFLVCSSPQQNQRLSCTDNVLCKTCSVVFSCISWLKCHENLQTCAQALQAFSCIWTCLGSRACTSAACRALYAACYARKWSAAHKNSCAKNTREVLTFSEWQFLTPIALLLQVTKQKSFSNMQRSVRLWIHIV